MANAQLDVLTYNEVRDGIMAALALRGGGGAEWNVIVTAVDRYLNPPAPKARKAKVQETLKDVADMTRDELYTYRKRTAPYNDLTFFVNTATLSPALQRDAMALLMCVDADGMLQGLTRADFYRRYVNLQDAWRRESNTPEGIAQNDALQARRDADARKALAAERRDYILGNCAESKTARDASAFTSGTRIARVTVGTWERAVASVGAIPVHVTAPVDPLGPMPVVASAPSTDYEPF